MGFFEKKQSFGRERIGEGERPKKIPLPSKKEEKKDTSIFGGKPSIEKSDVRQWLQSSKLFERTHLKREIRIPLGEKIFGKSGLKPKELPGIKEQLKLGKQGRFRDLSTQERANAMKIVEQASRK